MDRHPPRYLSDQLGLHKPETGLLREAIPDRVRNMLVRFVDNLHGYEEQHLIEFIRDERDLTVQELPNPRRYDIGTGVEYDHPLATYFSYHEWHEVLDAASAVFYWLDSAEENRAASFRHELNRSLLRWYSAYTMDEAGVIYEPGTAGAEAAVAEARALLRDARFEGPDRQFQAAIEAQQRRPEPDCEGVVTSAYNAAEGVARIVLGDPRLTLGNAVKRIGTEKQLHAALTSGIGSLYGYASDAGGRHGLVGAPQVDRPIAEYCLHQAAATIVLFVRLYGGEVVVAGQ